MALLISKVSILMFARPLNILSQINQEHSALIPISETVLIPTFGVSLKV